MYGTFSVLGFIYIFLNVPETKGLSKQEKKEVFMPGSKFGRGLKNEEECLVGWEHKSDLTIHQEIYKSAVSLISQSIIDSDADTTQQIIMAKSERRISKLSAREKCQEKLELTNA